MSGCMRGQQKHRHAEGDREGAQKTHAVHENTTRGAFELNGLLTSSMGCLRAEGHVDSNPRKQRANRPAVVPRSRATASWHSRYAGFRGLSPRCAHMRHVPWVSDRAPPTTRGASDPRCRVQPSAARNGRHGPETRVAGSFVDTNFMSFFRNSDCVTKGATTAQRSVRSNKLMAGRSGLIRLRHLPPGIHMQPQARVANFKLLCDLRFAHGHVGHEKPA